MNAKEFCRKNYKHMSITRMMEEYHQAKLSEITVEEIASSISGKCHNDEAARQAAEIIHNLVYGEKKERWIRPTDKQLIDICILFNDGKLEAQKLADMLAPIEFILDRLFENGDVTIPSSKEEPPKK